MAWYGVGGGDEAVTVGRVMIPGTAAGAAAAMEGRWPRVHADERFTGGA